MNVLPSTSVSVAPRPSSITTGMVIESGPAITLSFRPRIAFERGPGIAVRSSIARVVATGRNLPERLAP
jgi:hypothetical protein